MSFPATSSGGGRGTTQPPAWTPAPTQAPEPASGFVDRHRQFVERLRDMSCFKREALAEFTDTEFQEHAEVAQQDKYLAKEGDMYCNMSGIKRLVDSIKRISNEQELL